jgi:hypothetical protein
MLPKRTKTAAYLHQGLTTRANGPRTAGWERKYTNPASRTDEASESHQKKHRNPEDGTTDRLKKSPTAYTARIHEDLHVSTTRQPE